MELKNKNNKKGCLRRLFWFGIWKFGKKEEGIGLPKFLHPK